uniref:Uncharacterized protein n=1 Tax=Rhizophora mucronata TaxID=61149 RepID=A0A2P2P326_RHIMU
MTTVIIALYCFSSSCNDLRNWASCHFSLFF